jgi:hypothetical protein
MMLARSVAVSGTPRWYLRRLSALGHAQRMNSSRASLDGRAVIARPSVSQAHMGATRLACFCRKTGLFFLDAGYVSERCQWLIRTRRAAVNKEETWPLDLWMWFPVRAERPRSPCLFVGKTTRHIPLNPEPPPRWGFSHRQGQGEGYATIALWCHGTITNSSRLLLSTHHGFVSSSSTILTTVGLPGPVAPCTTIDSPSDSPT